ncbi:MAG: DegQ family serine endoprotease [Zetaproteobacteria bacterium]|nr:MAG: DegQ family serine endoprotease [Zetaproteobacteria bacterium]
MRPAPLLFLTALPVLLPAPAAHALPNSFADLAAAQSRSVVNISTTKLVRPRLPGHGFGPSPFRGTPFDQFFQQFFNQMPPRETHALGSGFIISRDGYILTNNHVIEGADEIMVKLKDETELPAKVIGTDAKLDVALIKVEGHNFRPVTMGDSDKLRVGDWVVAIGNPFGLEQTVTAGIVSAKGRVIGAGPYDNFIQTDAAINPGNSGGPLFNIEGEVIGINTSIITRSGGSNGIGFAIPINLARSVLDDLKRTGHVERARLGVVIADIDKETQKALGLPNREGALVPQVEAGSAADRAGLRAGDVIVALDGKPVKHAHDLPIRIARHHPGDRVIVRIIRDGRLLDLPVELEEMPEDQTTPGGAAGGRHPVGVAVSTLDRDTRERLHARVDHGVVVERVLRGSPAARAGLERGDVIYRINGTPIDDVRDFRRFERLLEKGEALRVLIDRKGDQVFAVVQPPRK